jgi:hypothetical protein
MERNVVFTPGTIMVRSSVLIAAIPDRRIFESRQGQNWQMMLPIAYISRGGYLNQILFKYVEHPNSHSRMRRSYSEKIQRRDDFITLLTYTVRNIPKMPESEKEEWCRAIKIKQTVEKLHTAYLAICSCDIKTFRKELQMLGYEFAVKDSFVVVWVGAVFRKFRGIIKKVLMK